MIEEPTVIEHFDEAIAALHMLREVFAAAPLGEWHFGSSRLDCCITLLQLHPRDYKADNRESARTLARAVGVDWKRESGGSWRGKLKADPRFTVLLHHAEPAERELEDVSL
jgi:hypothetical protein